jgi:ABC-type transport system involved in multi-copper enzyme maturation permease subunit
MAWLIWRQHRAQLSLALLTLGLVGIAALVLGLPMYDAFHREAVSSCLPPASRSGCDIIVHHFESEFGSAIRATRYLSLLPALVGLFIGAPLLTRELEHGTYRLIWTQTITRRRWLLSKTALLSLAIAVIALALSGIVTWWRHPFDVLQGRMSPTGFDVEGIVLTSTAVFSFTLGVLVGALLKRSIPAMSVTLAAFLAVRLSISQFLRPHFAKPLHETVSGLVPSAHAGDWVLSNTLVDSVGRTITSSREELAIAHARRAGIDASSYLAQSGWKRSVTYQPSGRFWNFQLIEAGIFVALAVLSVAGALWIVRRRLS